MSPAVQKQLVEALFDQTATLIAGSLALATAAWFCAQRTHQLWFVLWALAILLVLAGRLALERAFHHRSARCLAVDTWRTGFIAGAWIMGVLWGVAALTIVTNQDPFVQMMILTVQIVIVMGASARNASCPVAVVGQTALGVAPVLIACLSRRELFYDEWAIFALFVFCAVIKLAYDLYDRQVRFLETDEKNCGLVSQLHEANHELARANERLEAAATTDSLTGIANRRRFDNILEREFRRAVRGRSALALLFLDIDAFKGFNDLYGHQAGDDCLLRVAQVLAASFKRPGDLVARYGGEEFTVILPNTDASVAGELAERTRQRVEALAERNLASPAGIVSVSIGVASFAAGRHARPEDFIRSADEAMYAAKHAGRNCVRSFDANSSDDGGMDLLVALAASGRPASLPAEGDIRHE